MSLTFARALAAKPASVCSLAFALAFALGGCANLAAPPVAMSSGSPAPAQGATAQAAPAKAAPAQAAPAALPTMTAAGSITVFYGGCFFSASCTTYDITVRPDGSYRLNGRDRTRTPGVSEGMLGAEAFAALEAALADAGFQSLPERMDGSDPSVWRPEGPTCIPHGPGLRITRRTGDGAERQVYWDTGCRSASNSALAARLAAAYNYDGLIRPSGE